MPLLLEGLQDLASKRPEDPLEHLAKFLLEKNPEKSERLETSKRNQND
jgi:hypothetical protein